MIPLRTRKMYNSRPSRGGLCQKRRDRLVEQVKAAAQMDVGPQNGRTIAPRAIALLRPAQGSHGGVFPEVDAVAQPVPLVGARLPLADRLFPCEKPPRKP